MAKGQQRYSQDTKQAVIAALLAGELVSEVARRYKVSKPTVSRWRSALSHSELKQSETKRESDIATLLLEYLRETISALTERARLSKGAVWFSKQSAADIADLDGTQFDRAIRLLEAIERANQSRQPDPELPASAPKSLSA